MEQQCMLGHNALLQHIITWKLYSWFFWLLILSKILNDQFDQQLRAPFWNSFRAKLKRFTLILNFGLKQIKNQHKRLNGKNSDIWVHFSVREKVFQNFFKPIFAVISDHERVAIVGSSYHRWQTCKHKANETKSFMFTDLLSPTDKQHQEVNRKFPHVFLTTVWTGRELSSSCRRHVPVHSRLQEKAALPQQRQLSTHIQRSEVT